MLVGSLRQDSYNRRLADAMAMLAPSDFVFEQALLGDLPLYNQDDDAHQAPAVVRLKSHIKSAHGLLTVCHTGIQPFHAGRAQTSMWPGSSSSLVDCQVAPH